MKIPYFFNSALSIATNLPPSLSSVTSIVLGMNASSTPASAPAACAHKGKATIAETISKFSGVAPRLPTNVRSRTQVQTQTIRIGGEIHRAFSRRSEAPWNGNPIMT